MKRVTCVHVDNLAQTLDNTAQQRRVSWWRWKGVSLMAPPLTGLTVVDLTRVLAGPYCTMLLGDMGAEVIKIERPDGGDDTRGFGPPYLNGESAMFLAINRNKKSMTLNLKHSEAKRIFAKLVERCDVLVENFRPGTMTSLGFDYATVSRINPRIIYCSISG